MTKNEGLASYNRKYIIIIIFNGIGVCLYYIIIIIYFMLSII